MPKRSEKRDTAKAEYIKRKGRGETVNLRELAESLGASYQTLRNWKIRDKWDEALPKRKKKRGGQPGNRNSAGKQNASGSHDGAPKGNKNAEKDGAYSAIFFDMLDDSERELAEKTPTGSRENLIHELQILKVREHRILKKIAEYEKVPEDKLFLSSLMDMREPGKDDEGNRKDGLRQQMGMYSSDTAFSRIMKLNEALYKVQGRIASITNAIRAAEESERRSEFEKRRLEIMLMKATGTVDVEPEETEEMDLCD